MGTCMKKIILLAIALVCVLYLAGCSKGSILLIDGTVKKVTVTSLPEYSDYSFTGEKAKAVVDYLSDLSLTSVFFENPDRYGGWAWVISLEYESGETVTIYDCGMFIMRSGGSWYKTKHNGSRFEKLLEELSGRPLYPETVSDTDQAEMPK